MIWKPVVIDGIRTHRIIDVFSCHGFTIGCSTKYIFPYSIGKFHIRKQNIYTQQLYMYRWKFSKKERVEFNQVISISCKEYSTSYATSITCCCEHNVITGGCYMIFVAINDILCHPYCSELVLRYQHTCSIILFIFYCNSYAQDSLQNN